MSISAVARPTSFAFLTSLALGAAIVAGHAYLLGGVSYGAPRNPPSPHPVWLGPVANGDRLAQTLYSEVGGLDSIGFHVRPIRGGGTRAMHVELIDEWNGDDLGSAVLEIDGRAGERRIDWQFPPIAATQQRQLRFAITVDDPAGIEVEVTPDPSRYVAGRLFLGPREQWSDLRFDTTAVRTRAWTGMMYGLARDWPGRPAGLIVSMLLALHALALVGFLTGLSQAVPRAFRRDVRS